MLTARGRTGVRVVAVVLLAVAGVCAFQAFTPVDSIAEPDARTARGAATAMWSPRRLPGEVSARVGAAALATRLTADGSVVRQYPSCLAVDDAGGPIVRHRAAAPLVPASTEKILTGAAALLTLGPDHRFETPAIPTAPLADGVVDGDLVVVGSGDPVLATDAFIDELAASPRTVDDVTTPLADLADAIAGAGVERITGSVLGEDSLHDGTRFLDSWKDSYWVEVGPLGALAVDHGFTDYGMRTRAPDPAVHAAEALTGLLEARGVEIGGTPGRASAVPDADPLAVVTSPPLDEIVAGMISSSNNFVAEVLTRAIVAGRDGASTTEGGTAAIVAALDDAGITTTRVQLADGSGLSPANRATCAALLETLDRASEDPTRLGAVIDGLADAGESGTLASRFQGSPVQGRLHAKTGQIGGVVGLTGILDGPRPLRFAFIANGPFDPGTGMAMQEELVAGLDTYQTLDDAIEVPAP